MFSAPEGQIRCSPAALPPPTTNPFQAPDFGEDENGTYPFEDEQGSAAPGMPATRSEAA